VYTAQLSESKSGTKHSHFRLPVRVCTWHRVIGQSDARSVLSSCAAWDEFGAQAERAYISIKLTQLHVLSLASCGN